MTLPDLPSPRLIAFDESIEIKGYNKDDMRQYAAHAVAEYIRANPIRRLVHRLLKARRLHGSPSSYRARPDGQDLNPVSVKDLSASASPATKEQQ